MAPAGARATPNNAGDSKSWETSAYRIDPPESHTEIPHVMQQPSAAAPRRCGCGHQRGCGHLRGRARGRRRGPRGRGGPKGGACPAMIAVHSCRFPAGGNFGSTHQHNGQVLTTSVENPEPHDAAQEARQTSTRKSQKPFSWRLMIPRMQTHVPITTERFLYVWSTCGAWKPGRKRVGVGVLTTPMVCDDTYRQTLTTTRGRARGRRGHERAPLPRRRRRGGLL